MQLDVLNSYRLFLTLLSVVQLQDNRALPLWWQAVIILPISFILAHFTSVIFSLSIFQLVLLLLSNFHLRW